MATVSAATTSASPGAIRRRARKYAGMAASDMTTPLIVFAAVYAVGTDEKSRQAGAITIG